MAKNLTSTLITKEDKVLNYRSDAKIQSPVTGEIYKLQIDRKFRKTKIMELTSELLVKIQDAKQKGINMEAIFIPYVMLLIVKHFTSIGNDMPADVTKQIGLLNKLIDLELLNPILMSFEDGEVESVYEAVTETLDKIEEDAKALNDRLAAIEMQMEYDRITSEGNEPEDE
ncbi:hypothetical protein MKY96_33135 [Paenibacillus sp. FSL R7-0302]|uniref:hypothetical protein n=1 Tax=Paenibacillus sp. FSL R7-0302 TaxID=2921681 RepID=UPI0030F604CA